MAHDPARPGQMFSSPTMAARAALVRALALLEELERAEAQADAAKAQRLAKTADDTIQEASRALSESWARAVLLEVIDPAAEGMAQYQADGR